MQYQPSSLTVQWRITTRCPNRCKHCYMYDDRTYNAERHHELSDKTLWRVLENLCAFEKTWQTPLTHFAISGGDPLQRPVWRELFQELRRLNKSVLVMGVPESLNEDSLDELARLGVKRFQLSLDGLKQTHDSLRGKGSFARTVAALEKLKDRGIETQIMFTLHGGNRHELLPLVRYVAEKTAANRFAFDLLAAVGNGTQLDNDVMELGPHALLETFTSYLEEKRLLREAGNPLVLREKSHLFKMLRAVRGDVTPVPYAVSPDAGECLVGFTCTTILADGSVAACRRFPWVVGKLPEQDFAEVFLCSETLKKFRRPAYFSGCGECEYFTICRGCPAVVFGQTGDLFAPPAFCFKDLLQQQDISAHDNKQFESPPLTTSPEQEYDIIARSFMHANKSNLSTLLRNGHILRALKLLREETERAKYASNPQHYLQEKGISLNQEQRFFVETFTLNLDANAEQTIDQALRSVLFG